MTWIRFCKLHSLSWCQQQAARKKINKWLTKQKIDVVFTQTIVTYKMANHCFVYSFVSMANDDMGGNQYKTSALGLKPFCCQLSHVCNWQNDEVIRSVGTCQCSVIAHKCGSFSVSSNAILKGKYHKTKTFGCIERSYDYQASKSPNQVEIAEQAIKTQSINQKHMQWERRKAKQC